MTITQHNMFGFGEEEAPKAEFHSLRELIEIPWVKRWSTSPVFLRFSRSSGYLMAELSNGQFWVVGFMSETPKELPEWRSMKP